MTLRTLLFGTLSFTLLWFLGWTAWSIYAARAALPEIFAPFEASAAWASLTPAQQAMILAVEDPAFFAHKGLDRSTPGVGETIPERLAAWLFEGRTSPGISRAEHMAVALLVITPLTAKETQLNAYLSSAPLGTRAGEPITGFAAAAQTYFRTSLPQLSDNQFARLLAMVEDPARFEMNSEANWRRVGRIEALMDGTCTPLGPSDTLLAGCAQ